MAEQSKNPGAVTNSFTKGMVKDMNETFVGDGLWTHARNLVNNTHDGQTGIVGNEPANLHCVTLPYTLIGAVHLTDDQWAVFTTDDKDSEIGIFDESMCRYTTKVNDRCLAFKRSHPITGVSRRRYDCALPVYWADGLNPDRFMDLDNPPFKIKETVVNGCIIKEELKPRQLDCEKIRLAAIVKQPCLDLNKGKGAGTLANGSYQVCIAYTINQVRITDYIGLSNVQSLFDHENVNGALAITVKQIDTEFDEFELIIISTINAQTVAKRLGYYSTAQGTIYIDSINPELVSIPLNQLALRTEAVEKSDAVYSVNGYMLRVGPYSKYQFNYQQQANKITSKWLAVEYPSSYYVAGNNNVGYLRDEQYAFFIRWVYNTGERSASFHIPGRAATAAERVNVYADDAFETTDADPEQRQLWQVQNTASVDSLTSFNLGDGGQVIASGRMAYWESTELYPADRPDIWGDLCGKPIRHHKFPDVTVSSLLNHYKEEGAKIVIMGVEFSNITVPLGSDGKPISSIVGYEILRGSREGNKSIIAKGLINNLREYNIPSSSIQGLYQNFPYNELGPDMYHTSNPTIIDKKLIDLALDDLDDTQQADDVDDEDSANRTRRESKRKLKEQRNRLKKGAPDAGDVDLRDPLTLYRKNYLSFHSPDTTFTKPFLGISELKVYQELHGQAVGKFIHPFRHPKFKTVTNFSAIFSSVIATLAAIGNVLSVIAQDANITLQGTEDLPSTKKLTLTKVPNFSVEANVFGTGASIPNPVIAAYNGAIGFYNATMAIAMTFIEASSVGEQIMNIIYGMIPRRQNALQYDSHGFYNQTIPNITGNRRFKVQNSTYVGNGVQSFDTNFSINNVYRSNFVALKINRDLKDPSVVDNSRFFIGNRIPGQNISSRISGYYGALKVSVPSQYGQLESIKQIPVDSCVYSVVPDAGKKYTTDVIFGGDTYINRFTEKNTMFFFNSWLMGEPDESEINYRDYINIPYPRFWIDSVRQSFKLFTNASNFRHLDERTSSLFFVSKGYFYLFNSGVRDFFVESEVNVAYRDWEEEISKRHFDINSYQDLGSLFRSDIIKSGNYYKYDYSLSVTRLFNNYASWGTIYPRDYNPAIAETCYVYRPKRVVYSLPQEQELKKDNWRIFLPNNYKDFNGQITVVKSVNKTGALFMMYNQSPVQFTGVDQLQTDIGTKITLGDGGLFQQPLQNIVNSDESYEYGSCQNRFAVASTTHGVFWVSQNQGKVFQFAGQLNEISRNGMKWWFSRYLPSELLKVFPDYPLYDNPVSGVGVQVIYDNTYELIYICKKDYRPKFNDLILEGTRFYRMINGIKTYYDLNSEAFENASWTISYDPKTQTWLSFHDWKPSFLLPSKTHFMSVSGNGIWKHNTRCDLFCNFYGIDYPFEVEFVSSTGQMVNSVRNVEYMLEAYKFYNQCADKFHILDENFDQAMIYNSEQVSGLLELVLKDKANPLNLLTYPQVGAQSIKINYSKEENKYRFNQFWDVTKNRGEFTSAQVPMFITKPNGYEYAVNPAYIDYLKSPLERKKFRHTVNRVFLRKLKSGDVKLLLKLSNQKLLQSPR